MSDELVNIANSTEAEAVAEIVKQHIKPELVDVSTPDGKKAMVLVTPPSLTVKSVKALLDEYREHPERREGTAVLQDLDSLIAHANRFKSEESALFADRNMESPSITSVLDYHDACNTYDDAGGIVSEDHDEAKPRFCQHRGLYVFPLSDEWKAWKERDGILMDQGGFAEFLENRIGDVAAPPDLTNAPLKGDDSPETKLAHLKELLGGDFANPGRLMELSRGLSVHVNEAVKNATNLATGEMQIQYVASHTDDQGQPLKVPSLFLITIPVFRSGPLYQIAVRLRYRARDGGIKWAFQLYRPEKVFEHAFDEACATAKERTGLPLFIGYPETKI